MADMLVTPRAAMTVERKVESRVWKTAEPMAVTSVSHSAAWKVFLSAEPSVEALVDLRVVLTARHLVVLRAEK